MNVVAVTLRLKQSMAPLVWHMQCHACCGPGTCAASHRVALGKSATVHSMGKRTALHCVVPTGALQCILWREPARCHALSGASKSSAVPSMARVSASLHTLWLACALLDSMAFDKCKDAVVGALP